MEDCTGDCYKEISNTGKTVREGSFFYMENHCNEHLDILVFYFIISSKMKYSKMIILKQKGVEMVTGIEFSKKLLLLYNAMCKPLCRELNLPQTSLDILLFLANNPEYKTARDIVELRNIKANLVSVNVDKLVHEGYLERRTAVDDRRKTELICTQKADPVIRKGRLVQQQFAEKLFEDISEEERTAFFNTMQMIEKNLTTYLKGQN